MQPGQTSALWEYLAAGKRAVLLEERERAPFETLLSSADIFITDLSEIELSQFRMTLKGLRKRHRHLCVISLGHFGSSGPYRTFRGSELVDQALSGHMSLNGAPGMAPLRLPAHIGSFAIGANAFVGGLAAYFGRLRKGAGDLVEISAIETYATLTPFLRHQYLKTEETRLGGPSTGVSLFPCSDGWVSFVAATPDQVKDVARALNIAENLPPDLLNGTRMEIKPRAIEFFSARTSQMGANDVFLALERNGVACGQVLSPKSLLAQEQLAAHSFFETISTVSLGTISYPSGTPRSDDIKPARAQPAPAAAQRLEPHQLGWTQDNVVKTVRPARTLPLDGIRIADLTQAWIGPFATMLLADLGAEVIKIESHKRPDVWRQISVNPVAVPNPASEQVNQSPNFNSVNRNKKSLTLDLLTDRGKDIFLEVVRRSDIVAENYTPRVMDRFGLGWQRLKKENPNLVMLSSSGFGKTGPWSDFKTNGSAVEGLAGWDWLHGYSQGQPMILGFYQADPICGLHMAALMLLGLIKRERHGGGGHLDASMMDAAIRYLGDEILRVQRSVEPHVNGNRSPDCSPNGVFACAGNDRWLAISISDDDAWLSFLNVPGVPAALRDPAFATLAGRRSKENEVEDAISKWCATQDADELMLILQASGVAAGVVHSLHDMIDDPHLKARDWFKAIAHSVCGTHRYNGFAWTFADADLRVDLPPPCLGEHSAGILTRLLGISTDEIEKLKQDGITGAAG
jgi:crotonobetainyl-CoA:carnitine CoA-transferase CaiB-like acyl-CoA transferase